MKAHINPVPLNSKQYQIMLTQHHQVPTNTTPYWPRIIMNQPVPLRTDPVLSYTTSTALYCTSTTKYKPVPVHNDPVPPSINQYRRVLTQYHHISYSNVRFFFVDLRWAQLYVSLVFWIGMVYFRCDLVNPQWGFLMSRRFRICVARRGKESLRPSYGLPKLTLISRGKKKPKKVFQKAGRSQFWL